MRVQNPRQVFAWCQELLFITVCLVMAVVSALFLIFFGELISYHSFTLPFVGLLVCGILGTLVSFQVHYQRFFKQEQSRCCLIMVGLVFICSGMGAVIYMAVFTQQANHLGNMAAYHSDKLHKRMIDKTQMLFKCCGDVSYTDWFKIDWQGMDKVKCGQAFPMDVISRTAVPFSCCSPKARPPCVHNYLLMDKDARLYHGGCKEHLVFFGSIFLFVMATSLVVTGVLMLQWGYCCHDELVEPKYSDTSVDKSSSSSSDSCSGGSQSLCSIEESMSPSRMSGSQKSDTSGGLPETTVNTNPDVYAGSPFSPTTKGKSETSVYSKGATEYGPSTDKGGDDKGVSDTDVDTDTTAAPIPQAETDRTVTEGDTEGETEGDTGTEGETEGDTDTWPGYTSDVITEEDTGNETEPDAPYTDVETNETTAGATDSATEDIGLEGDTDVEGDTASEARGAESTGDVGRTGSETDTASDKITNDDDQRIEESAEEDHHSDTTVADTSDKGTANNSETESLTVTARTDPDKDTTVLYSDNMSNYSNALSASGEVNPIKSKGSVMSSRELMTSTMEVLPQAQLSGLSAARSVNSNEATLGSTTDIRTGLDEKTDEDDARTPSQDPVTNEKTPKAKRTQSKSLKWNTFSP